MAAISSSAASTTDPLAAYMAANGASSGSASGASSADPNGEDRFLTLLVAQLKNQDPLNPLDNAQVTSQLAQINTVKGLDTLNKNVTKLGDSLSANQLLGATSMIGRQVLTEGSTVSLADGGAGSGGVKGGIKLDGAADTVKVSVQDSAGKEVASLSLGALAAGTHRFNWDGLGSDNKPAAAGSYKLVVDARQGTDAVTATMMTAQQIQGLNRADGGVNLLLSNGKSMALADAQQLL